MEELGTGVLDWEREERISDRYGVVKLFDQPGPAQTPVRLRRPKEGYGRLVAVVRESGDPPHIGDLFHRVFPSKPEVGEQVSVGEGTLFFDNDGVGLMPDDGRETLCHRGLRFSYRINPLVGRLAPAPRSRQSPGTVRPSFDPGALDRLIEVAWHKEAAWGLGGQRASTRN